MTKKPLTAKIKTPTLDKMKTVQPQSQAIGSFLEWLTEEKRVSLMHTIYDDEEHHYYDVPFIYSIEKLLAKYFEIDLDKAEKEKQAVLDSLRTASDKSTTNP